MKINRIRRAAGLVAATAAVATIATVGGCGGSVSNSSGTSTPALQATSTVVNAAGAIPTAVIQLPRFRIDPAKVFVAGISAGGFGAVQMHVAHSSTF